MPEATFCPFCEITQKDEGKRVLSQNEFAFVIRDHYPVSDGHTLIIPKRHVSSFFETTWEEKRGMLSLLDEAKQQLDREYMPSAYNIGINNGTAAGQTVKHCHMHLIPRYEGDRTDPRGGVRWINPDKANYWDEKQ